MTELNDLYSELILDHSKKPHNFHKMEDANRTAEGFNPLCGDRITVYLKVEGPIIREISFEGLGCAISKASASMMTVSLKEKTKEEAENIFSKFHKMVTQGAPPVAYPTSDDGFESNELGKLRVFSGVCDYPVRVKCATLAWHTLLAALKGTNENVSTES